MPGTVPPAQLSPGITQVPLTPQSDYAGVFVPNADGRFPIANVPSGYGMYREHENHVMRNLLSGVPLAATVNAMSMKGTLSLTPAAASTLISAVTGWSAPLAAIQGTLQAIIISASAAGAYMNYNGVASATTMPVPTIPMMIPVSYADLALLRFFGNGSVTVNIILLGFVPPI